MMNHSESFTLLVLKYIETYYIFRKSLQIQLIYKATSLPFDPTHSLKMLETELKRSEDF